MPAISTHALHVAALNSPEVLMSVPASIAARHFSRATLRALAIRDIALTGTTIIPGDGDMPWATGETGFKVNDNGCGKVWTFADVLKAAK